MNKQQYDNINSLITTDKKSYDTITSLFDSSIKNISFASHEIKNQLSFINSSYQLISYSHPEINNIPYWNTIGLSIKQLITFMERTTTFRYCLKCNLEKFNLNDLLYILPDKMDELKPESLRSISYDLFCTDTFINGDFERLQIAMCEILSNCYEATSENDTIIIQSEYDNINNIIKIRFINKGQIIISESNISNIDSDYINMLKKNFNSSDSEYIKNILCHPFYTNKQNHCGLGLSLAENVCTYNNGSLDIYENNGYIITEITLPVI